MTSTNPPDPQYTILNPEGKPYGLSDALRAWMGGDRIQASLKVDRHPPWPFEAILHGSPFSFRPVLESAARRNLANLLGSRSDHDRLPAEVHVPFRTTRQRLVRNQLDGGRFWQVDRLLTNPFHFGTARTEPLLPAKKTLRADPFSVRVDGVDWILFEEQKHADRGRLRAARRSGSNWDVIEEEILHLPHHLSWPNVFEFEGRLFLMPETGEAGEVALWACERFPDRWTKVRTLLSGRPFHDPCLLHDEGRWWLFVSAGGTHPGDHSAELCLFHAKSLFQDVFEPHRMNPLSVSVAGSRPAGQVFRHQGSLIRPAQDCRAGYGTGLLIRRIERLTVEDFAESALGRISPPAGTYGIHTLNRLPDGTWIVDVLR
ncbi:MAG: hypothetical protein IPK50_16160 [Fibrobacterota bacterium]|nr:hypothetical protein [Fibrobacterota bacterium]QQS03819.1 MAG: hypothetical protein IPK50_16160 [Fibrobacterota bacterium]